MSLYSPPSGNNVNFELKSYTPPSGNNVNFTLEGVQPETKFSKFFFNWILFERISSTSWFSWNLLKSVKNSIFFKWKLLVTQRLYHLISYPLHLTTPTLSEFNFTVSVAGLLDSLTIDVYDTGSSGQTKIEIYSDEALKKSIVIPASNQAYHTYMLLDNSLIYVNNKIKIKITEVATGIDNLTISIKQKTFPPFLDILKVFNVYRGVSFESQYLFGSADKWLVVLNQPINKLDNVLILNSDDDRILPANYTQITGEYKNNRIELNADVSGDTIIVHAQTINNEFNSINKKLEYKRRFSDYPTYVKEAFSFITYLPVKMYMYSWDNNNWYGPYDPNNRIIEIDNLPTKEGENTLYIKYYFDKYGVKVLSDKVTINYYYSEVKASIKFFSGVT